MPLHLIRNSNVALDEDQHAEFKAHRDVAMEDLPAWASREKGAKLDRSRQPISKTLCAFLNSAGGGRVYVGVSDGGQVQGLKLSTLQKDHLRLSLVDVLGRYSPPVPRSRVRPRFVAVRDEGAGPKDWETEGPLKEDARRAGFEHSIRSPACPCDAKSDEEEAPSGLWVWELEVVGSADLSPLFRNEEGLVYTRCLSSNIQMSAQGIVELTETLMCNEKIK